MNHSAALNVIALYAGKLSGIAVSVFFLPMYSRLLGPELFGIVALFFSLQALLMLTDVGASTLVGRNAAAADKSLAEQLQLLKTAEMTLGLLYSVLLGIALLAAIITGRASSHLLEAIIAVPCLLLLVLQNIYYSGLLGFKAYHQATAVQSVGLVGRALATWLTLQFISPTLLAFLLAQLVCTALHCWFTRKALIACFGSAKTSAGGNRGESGITLADCFSHLRRNRPLLLSGLVGAAAMQLDKPLISAFISPAAMAPYFLAVTLSAAPLAVLAAPLIQYFQPLLTGKMIQAGSASYFESVRTAHLTVIAVTVTPMVLMYLLIEPICQAWLQGTGQAAMVAGYARPLLLAYGVAAIGYIPFAIVTAQQDYKFQALLSTWATAFILISTALAAMFHRIDWVCNAYVGYFSISTIGLWIRSASIHRRLRTSIRSS